MKNSQNKQTIKFIPEWLILSLVVLVFLGACDQYKKNTTDEIPLTFLSPGTVLIDTCPPPETIDLKDVQIGQDISIIKTSEKSFDLRTPDGSLVKDMKSPTIQKMPAPVADFSNFNTEDGLALNTIYCGLRDKNGNLWFGSEGGGLSCYNGKRFTNFTVDEGLKDNTVRGLVEDKNGNIWIATDAGLTGYDGQKFINYGISEGFRFGPIRSMIIDKNGKLWIGTLGSGVISFDPTKTSEEGSGFKKLDLPSNRGRFVRAIQEDKAGNLWFSNGRGIIRYNPNVGETSKHRFTSYSTENGLSSNDIWSMLEDSQGNMWFGTRGEGVSRFIPEKDKPGEVCFVTYKVAQGLAHNFVRNMFEDNQGNIWFCTLGGGVSRLDADWKKGNGELFVNYTTDQGLTTNSVYCIIDDIEGNLWLGTRDGGVDKYKGESIYTYDFEQGLFPNRARSILEDKKGNIWLGVEDRGFSRFDGENYINYSLMPPLFFLSMTEERNGTLWFGGYGITGRFIPSQDESGAGVLSIYRIGGTGGIAHDNEGNLWIGNIYGVTKFNGNDFTRFTTSQGLVHPSVNCIVEDQSNKIWIGTRGGVSRYDGTSFTNFTTSQGLIHNHVTCIVEDHHGNIWFGTKGGGISRYDGKGFISYTTVQGIADNVVSGLEMDEQGILWIGTNKGLSSLRFSKSTVKSSKQIIIGAGALDVSNEELKTYTPVWEIYNNTSGYPVRNMFANAMTLTKVGLPKGGKKDTGVIWGGYGDDKVIRFDPKAVRKSKEPLPPFIESIRVKEEIIPWYSLSSSVADSTSKLQQEIMAFGRALLQQERVHIHERFDKIKFDGISKNNPIPQSLELPYQHNQISFEFGAIETGRPIQVRYRYMLEGYDEDWNPITAKTSATYGNMFEGGYTFNVKAMSPDGVWSEPIQYTFRVLPPLWRSWWAFGIYVIFLALGVRVVHLFQKKRVLRIEKEKAQQSELEQAKEIEKAYKELEVAHSDLKSTQTQLIQSEKMASLGELTAGIAHEIQNPLNFVNNFSEVSAELVDEMSEEIEAGNLADVKEITSDLKQNLAKIHHHGQRASGIVKGMLEHSRTGDGVQEPTDINTLLDEYVRLAYHGLRAKDKSFQADFKTDLDPTLPKIKVVPQDMGRVFLNLINNAFYAVDKKAKQGMEDYKPEVIVSTQWSHPGVGQGGNIEIKISDNGPGIPDEIKDKIFQPFFTTKPTGSGTGLGLSLSYDIAKAHEGTLEVKSSEGKGTEFVLQIPIK